MDKRFDMSRSTHDSLSHSKKGKKRSGKKSGVVGAGWTEDTQSPGQREDVLPGMEYPQVLWQSGMQQGLPAGNGQRLFTAVSDPSMCGYSPVPMTYTMEPVSLPTMYRLYQPVAVPGVRPMHGRPRRNFGQAHVGVHRHSMAMPNGFSSLQENGMESSVPAAYQNGDYASLPPTGNKSSEIDREELNSEHRRYSDPGLGPADIPLPSQSDESDSASSGSSITTVDHNNKLVLSLIEQITELKKSNSRLFKELNETRTDLENVKAKLAQYKSSGSSEYQPGMLSDLVREIREANKTCEEVVFTKVKSMMEEKQNQRSTELEQLRSQLLKLAKERDEGDRRILKLEEEVATLKLNANNEGREIAAFEEETLALRRELQEARASRTLAENHAAKLERLVEILRKKMSGGATDEETIANIRDLVASGVRSFVSNETVGQASSEEEEEEDIDEGEREETDREVSKCEVKSLPASENSLSLSGPVTDL